jgi:hypothetical protein
LCYTFNVEEKYKFWRIWADHLQYWGLDEFAAGVLEAAGPFNLILAQLVYLGQPLFSSTTSQVGFRTFAALLEDQAEAQSFVQLLREGMHT